MSPYELDEIRCAVREELAEIEAMCHWHGTYKYVCCAGGITFLAHKPVGRVIREF